MVGKIKKLADEAKAEFWIQENNKDVSISIFTDEALMLFYVLIREDVINEFKKDVLHRFGYQI